MIRYKNTENDIAIVEYEDSLAETLADMWNRSKEEWGGDDSIRTASQIISDHAGAANYNVYVAMAGEEAVGYCSLGRYYHDANTLYIPLLNVRPDYHGRGIGKALVLTALERTMELGYPRLDLHTWAGNTAAVPLYKKCGFLWEDRSDATNLVNFIPSILKTPLFGDFFKRAGWYADSTRSLDIKPDGIKVNKFELFDYSWERDGKTLAIGYERSGRQIYMIETNDYKIELLAKNHEAAFGLDYPCAFKVENKTGRRLNIKICGKKDKNIDFSGFSLNANIKGSREFPGTFHVGPIDRPQDRFKTYPCLLADVEINGHVVQFGLGIEAKFPLQVDIFEECYIPQAGMEVDVCINIVSALEQDAAVKFNFPQNGLISFKEDQPFTADISKEGKKAITARTEIIGMGYEAIPVEYQIEMADGTKLSLNKPLRLVHQSLTDVFSFENDYGYSIVNGPWSLTLKKGENVGELRHLTNEKFRNDYLFPPPRLGKPYDDEFILIKPVVCMYLEGTDMVMEARFVSGKFEGMELTQIITLSMSGIVARRYKIENCFSREKNMMLNDEYFIGHTNRMVFNYEGKITQNHNHSEQDAIVISLEGAEPDKLGEHWVFDAGSPVGFMWPLDYKPGIKWGDSLSFDIDLGTIKLGETFETKPFICAYGIFNNYNDFRNYAMRQHKTIGDIPVPPVQLRVNQDNPFMTADTEPVVEVMNNRARLLEAENNFDKFDKHGKILFYPSGSVNRSKNGSVYTVNNGSIIFKVDPNYSNGCYSLISEEKIEWLHSRHPVHEPYAWWNPYFGGIHVLPQNINNAALLKEEMQADFVELADNFGNKWSGICSTMTVKNHDELKGSVYESYFLTMPGLPMLCAFFRFANGTGIYMDNISTQIQSYLKAIDLKEVKAKFKDKDNIRYNLRLGTEYTYFPCENAIVFSGRGRSLCVFYGNKHNDNTIHLGGDTKFVGATLGSKGSAAPDKAFVSRPGFFILNTESSEGLEDLERIVFFEEN